MQFSLSDFVGRFQVFPVLMFCLREFVFLVVFFCFLLLSMRCIHSLVLMYLARCICHRGTKSSSVLLRDSSSNFLQVESFPTRI